MNVTELIDSYCRVWNEEHASTRKALLDKVWGFDAVYTDPTVASATKEQLLKHIGAVRENRPGAKIVRTTIVDCHHGVARFGWQLVRADGSRMPEGLDIAFISADGSRIERIIGFFSTLAPVSTRNDAL